MNKISVILAAILVCPLVGHAADLEFAGSKKKVISITADKSEGLENIYVIDNISGVTALYQSAGDAAVEWYEFGNSGGGFAEKIDGIVKENNTYKLLALDGNCGYIIKEGNRQYAFWVVDYSKYIFDIESIEFSPEQDCGMANLDLVANCTPIQYYTINGVPKQLDRNIIVSYDTQVFNAETMTYENVGINKPYSNIGEKLVLPAPLCNTVFTITGDRFLSEWGIEDAASSDTYITNSIEVQTSASQMQRDNDNEKNDGSESLGGSAPAEITFTAYCSDAVDFKEWQFASSADFSEILFKMNGEEATYTFTEEGTTFVKFIGGNADGTCLSEGEVYNITIGESMLDCPNAFSPNATEGINDEWKVSYKSIISFKCWIFDRYGNKMAYFEDPAKGWDGKYKGKYVNPGVYFYVIEAVGADNKEYKKKGDINILKSSK